MYLLLSMQYLMHTAGVIAEASGYIRCDKALEPVSLWQPILSEIMDY